MTPLRQTTDRPESGTLRTGGGGGWLITRAMDIYVYECEKDRALEPRLYDILDYMI